MVLCPCGGVAPVSVREDGEHPTSTVPADETPPVADDLKVDESDTPPARGIADRQE